MALPFFRVPGQAAQHRMRLSVDGYNFITIHMRYDSNYLNLPQNSSLPRGGGLGWGQGYKFQKPVPLPGLERGLIKQAPLRPYSPARHLPSIWISGISSFRLSPFLVLMVIKARALVLPSL